MNRILIANRGEIAVRIARACADTGRASIAVYADPDADALFVRLADEAWALDGATPADSYLNPERLLHVARRAGADAVHPGYGFLAESAEFARAVEAAGLVWIGPPPAAIDLLGDKVSARRVARDAGAPLVEGSEGPLGSADEAVAFAARHGLPIAIKAVHGGGGRGMRVARHEDEIVEQYESAVREATQAFGRGECYIEQYLDRPRHVEVQVLADRHGTVLALGTRDCSLQRRHQKLVEEAPAPFLSDEQRETLTGAAIRICRAVCYEGVGTVEFLVSPDGRVSFLEVNTRLQVEHPVTEETTGLDLVGLQFRVAAGERLGPELVRAEPLGHAIEFRINAEDPGRGYLPVPGRVERFAAPSGPGVRIDAGVADGSAVPAAFDSLLAKLVVHGPDRATAVARARRALAEFEVTGVATVLPFHRAVLEHPDFVGDVGSLRVHTRWIEEDFAREFAPSPAPSPDDPPLQRIWIEVDGRRVRLGLPAGLRLATAGVRIDGGGGPVGPREIAGSDHSEPGTADVADAQAAVRTPVVGSLVAWLVENGADVAEGDAVAVVEAMKMETRVIAPRAGRLDQLVAAGSTVDPARPIGRLGP